MEEILSRFIHLLLLDWWINRRHCLKDWNQRSLHSLCLLGFFLQIEQILFFFSNRFSLLFCFKIVRNWKRNGKRDKKSVWNWLIQTNKSKEPRGKSIQRDFLLSFHFGLENDRLQWSKEFHFFCLVSLQNDSFPIDLWRFSWMCSKSSTQCEFENSRLEKPNHQMLTNTRWISFTAEWFRIKYLLLAKDFCIQVNLSSSLIVFLWSRESIFNKNSSNALNLFLKFVINSSMEMINLSRF